MNAQANTSDVLDLQRLPELDDLALGQVQNIVCFGTDVTCTACTDTCSITLDD